MKKITAVCLLLLLSLPLFSQSVSDLISDLEEVSQIISDLENSNETLKEQLQNLLQNETLREQQLGSLEASAQKREELLERLSAQLQQAAQASRGQTKLYEKLLRRYKILSYCTVGLTAAGATGWILWAVNK